MGRRGPRPTNYVTVSHARDGRARPWRVILRGPFARAAGKAQLIETFATEAAARRRARQAKADIREAERGEVSAREAVRLFIADLRGRGRGGGTTATAESRLAPWLDLIEERHGKGASLDEVSPRDVRDRLAQLKSPNSQRGTLFQLRALYRWAQADGCARQDPTAGIRVELPNRHGKHALTTAEGRSLVAYLLEQDSDVSLALLLCLLLGLRSGEVRLARVRALDLEGSPPTWHVERETTKTDNGVRTVKLPQVLAARLGKLVDGRAFDEAVFVPGRDATWRSKTWLSKALTEACRKAKVSRVCPQGLRDTHAQLPVVHGASVDIVTAVLGHGDKGVTIRSYVGRPVHDAAIAAKVIDLFKAGRKKRRAAAPDKGASK